MIVDYLIKKNHKKIAFVNIDEEFNFAFQRKESFFESMKKNKIRASQKNYFTISQNNPELSFQKVKNFLYKNPEITSIICCTEYIAAGAIKACDDLSLKIGKDISLITYDSLVISHLTNPSLTSISHPVRELGNQAVNILLEMRSKKGKNKNYMATPTIIERGSVAKLLKK